MCTDAQQMSLRLLTLKPLTGLHSEGWLLGVAWPADRLQAGLIRCFQVNDAVQGAASAAEAWQRHDDPSVNVSWDFGGRPEPV